MKQELRTVERMVFIASDGKEFPTKASCLAYEAKLQEEHDVKIVQKIPWFSMLPPEADYDYDYHFYFVRDEHELEALKRYVFCNDSSANEFEPEKYPTWVRCVSENDGYGQIDEAVTHIESIEEYVSNLRETMLNKTPQYYRLDTKKAVE